MSSHPRKSPRPAFFASDVGGQPVGEWAEELGAWDHPEDLPYAALPIAEPFGEYAPPAPRPAVAKGDYQRPTLHPNDPEFHARAVEWGRREIVREAAYNTGSGGCVIAFGFERQSNEAMRARFAAIDEAERLRREREDARMAWCDDLGGGPWASDAQDGWCQDAPIGWPEDDRWDWPEWQDDPFGEDGEWAWCNEDHHAWCLDTGGGWCEAGENGFWEGADGFWTGEWGEGRWCDEDDRELSVAWAAWEAWCEDED